MDDDFLTHLHKVRVFDPIPFLQLLDSDAVTGRDLRERLSRIDVHHDRLAHCPRQPLALSIEDHRPICGHQTESGANRDSGSASRTQRRLSRHQHRRPGARNSDYQDNVEFCELGPGHGLPALRLLVSHLW